jgi:hypothetical protein
MLTVSKNPIFEIRPEDAQRELRQQTSLRRRGGRRVAVEALQRKNAVRDIETLPAPGESLHIICKGNFPLWSIVPAILTLTAPAVIERLSIATLGFSTSNAADLLALFDAGKIVAVDIVASVYFERQNPAEFRMMAEGLAARGQRLVALRSHAKVIAMKLSDGTALAVESSANLRSCRNIEQITIIHDLDLFYFHAGWVAQVIDAAGGKNR